MEEEFIEEEIELSEEHFDFLTKTAKERGITVNELIVEIVKEYLQSIEETYNPKPEGEQHGK